MADSLEATVDDVAAMGANEAASEIEVVKEDPEVALRKQYNRREFMTGMFALSTGLLLAGGGYLAYDFMYPRFKEGEFGGAFPENRIAGDIPESPAEPPVTVPDGKFHLVVTDEGTMKAIYMVCTHLGCLYKWQQGNWRFECPCHGSKFTHDGMYIEGPAARSLDYFDVTYNADGTFAIETGSKTLGGPAGESPARASNA